MVPRGTALLRCTPQCIIQVIHSLDQDTYTLLHSPRDKLELIEFEEYEKTYRLTALYLAFLEDVLRMEEFKLARLKRRGR